MSRASARTAISASDVLDKLEPSLKKLGFVKLSCARDKFSISLSAGATGYLFLDTKKRKEEILVDPIFGVRHERLMSALSHLGVVTSERFWPFAEPCWTVTESFGSSEIEKAMHNGPKFGLRLAGWVFARRDQIEQFGDQLINAVNHYVKPWFNRHTTLSETVLDLRKSEQWLGNETGFYVTAVGYYLLERNDDAWDVITKNLALWVPELPHHRKDAILMRRDRMWKFARNLVLEMKQAGWNPPNDSDQMLRRY